MCIKKYLNQGLGKKLADQFTNNCIKNGFKYSFGMIAHPASQKIMINLTLKCIATDLSTFNYKNIKLYGFLNLYYDELFIKSNLWLSKKKFSKSIFC